MLRAGDSWAWTRVFDGYPSGLGWAAQYVLNSSFSRFQFPAGSVVPDSDKFSFDIAVPAAQTASVPSGDYELYVILTNAAPAAQQTIKLQTVRVEPNILGAALGVDTRSFVKRTLDAIEAAIAGDQSPHVQEYEINGRRLQYTNRMDLYKLRSQYQAEYRAEQVASGEYTPKRKVGVFFRPSY